MDPYRTSAKPMNMNREPTPKKAKAVGPVYEPDHTLTRLRSVVSYLINGATVSEDYVNHDTVYRIEFGTGEHLDIRWRDAVSMTTAGMAIHIRDRLLQMRAAADEAARLAIPEVRSFRISTRSSPKRNAKK